MMIEELSYLQVSDVVKNMGSRGIIEFLEEISIPEANIFLCKYEGKRFNFKYDIDYGASIELVGGTSANELGRIREVIESELLRS